MGEPLLLLENASKHFPTNREAFSKEFQATVEGKINEVSPEVSASMMHQLSEKISNLIQSKYVKESLIAVIAISALIEVNYDEQEKSLIRFANTLRMVFQRRLEGDTQNVIIQRQVLEIAATTLGRLALKDDALATDFVEFEIRRALEWLQADRHASRRFAAGKNHR